MMMTAANNIPNPGSTGARSSGFTLIEVLVVIMIIGLLAVALRPAISSALGRGEEAETQTRLLALRTMIDKFEAKYGYFPPDDFVELGDELGVKAKRDTVNSGIESLVMFLSWKPQTGVDLTEHEDWLANTDGDDNQAQIPMLERSEKVEVVDSWGTPFAYFTNRSYKKKQSIRLGADGEGEDVIVTAFRNPNSSGFLAPRKYQLISAGPDLIFNTEDDIVHPPLPLDDE